MVPSYLKLTDSEWAERIDAAYGLLAACRVCPRKCGVDRLKDEKGICRAGLDPVVASCSVHFGEEPPLSGSRGSGTIFLANCNLRCVFCQNYEISHGKEGEWQGSSPKKYSNRRLYDTERNAYVTLSHVGDLIKQGREVEVVDASTHEDVTAFVLTQIVLEEAKKWARTISARITLRRGGRRSRGHQVVRLVGQLVHPLADRDRARR